jgi:hypothetical protein
MRLSRTIIKLSLTAFILLAFTSCDIVDKFDTFPVNIPIEHSFSVTGGDTFLTESESFRLTDYSAYNDNKDKIKEIKFAEASLRIATVDPTALTGNITVRLQNGTGSTLFNVQMLNVTPNNLKVTPLVLPVTAAEIALIDAYVAITGNVDFTATVSITTATTGQKTVEGVVALLFKTEIEP